MNAIVLTFDRLPLRFLGCYGNQWILTPNFDRLASQAVVFDSHFGENFSLSAANHAWWTGCYQFPRTHEQQQHLATLPGLMRRHGIQTRMFVEIPEGASAPNLPDFDEIRTVTGRDGLDVDQRETPFARLVRQAAEFLKQSAAQPDSSQLVWLKSQGVPSPWIPPRDYGTVYLDEFLEEAEKEEADEQGPDRLDESENADADVLLEGLQELIWSMMSQETPEEAEALGDTEWRMLRAVYGGYVTLLDRWLETLLDTVDQLPPESQPLLVITADTGEALGDWPRESGKPSRLFEEIIHTPLLVRLPDRDDLGSRRRELVQSVDLLPTLFDWFEIGSAAFPCDGRSLWPLIRNQINSKQHFTGRQHAFLGTGRDNCAVRTQAFYLLKQIPPVQTGNSESLQLYAKPDDLWEINNVVRQHPTQVDDLTATLDRFLATVP